MDGQVYAWDTKTLQRRDVCTTGKYGVGGLAAVGDHLWIFYVNRAVLVYNVKEDREAASLALMTDELADMSAAGMQFIQFMMDTYNIQ